MITEKNIVTILDLLVTAYGEKAYPLDSPLKMKKQKDLWSVMFMDDDPAEVLTAVKDCIATLQFPPKIADIKGRIAQNRLAGQLTEMEVWQIIRKAVEDSNSLGKARELYEAMPKSVQAVAGSPSQLRSWRTVSDEQFETVVMSMVTRTYRQVAQREACYHALPQDVQELEKWRIDGAKKPDALPAPEAPKYELPKEWEKKPMTDEMRQRLAEFTGEKDE